MAATKKRLTEFTLTVTVPQEMTIIVLAPNLRAACKLAYDAPIQSDIDIDEELCMWQPSQETDFTPATCPLVAATRNGDDITEEAKEVWNAD